MCGTSWPSDGNELNSNVSQAELKIQCFEETSASFLRVVAPFTPSSDAQNVFFELEIGIVAVIASRSSVP